MANAGFCITFSGRTVEELHQRIREYARSMARYEESGYDSDESFRSRSRSRRNRRSRARRSSSERSSGRSRSRSRSMSCPRITYEQWLKIGYENGWLVRKCNRTGFSGLKMDWDSEIQNWNL